MGTGNFRPMVTAVGRRTNPSSSPARTPAPARPATTTVSRPPTSTSTAAATSRGWTRPPRMASVSAASSTQGQWEIIPYQGADCGFKLPPAKAVALDKDGREMGPAELRVSRGLTYVVPVEDAFSYLLTATTGEPQVPGPQPELRDRVIAGETVPVKLSTRACGPDSGRRQTGAADLAAVGRAMVRFHRRAAGGGGADARGPTSEPPPAQQSRPAGRRTGSRCSAGAKRRN